METSIRDSEVFNCGLYIINSKRSTFNTYKQSAQIYLTQEGIEFLKEEIITLIREAQIVLKLCSFIVTDPDIFQAILDKAQNSNTAIFLLTQLDQSKLTDAFTYNDFLTQEEIKASTAQTHLQHIKLLYDSGVHVRATDIAHAKFAVADKTKGLITSANFTTPSLNLNTESGAFLDPTGSAELDRLFDIVFLHGTRYRQFLSTGKQNKILVVQKGEKILTPDAMPKAADSNLRFTYNTVVNNLYDEIVGIVNRANNFVLLSTYSIVELDALPELIAAVSNAILRGVKIFVFCRGMNYRPDHLIGSENLLNLGCKIFADIYNHSKGIVSEFEGMLFTANIDGKHGLKNGFEVGFVLDEHQRQEFQLIHEYLIDTSYYEFKSDPIRSDFFNTYQAYEVQKKMQPPNFPKEIVIVAGKNYLNLSVDLVNHPLYYGKFDRDEFIIAGNKYYSCRTNSGKIQILEEVRPRFNLERYCIKYEHLKIQEN